MDEISVFSMDSEEYHKLYLAAALMTMRSPKKIFYYVETLYFDYGAGILWTTIVADTLPPEDERSVTDSWQAINPSEQRAILEAENLHDIEAVCDKYFADKNCTDRCA